jgi:hypothetical protein
VSWWQAEGDALDAIGTNNGTAIGNATFVNGIVGQAFSFDGNGSAFALSDNVTPAVQDFSVEAWIQRSSSTMVSGLAGRDALFFSFGPGGYGVGLNYEGRPLLSRINVDSLTPDFIISDTDFHHVAITKDGSNVVFYVDGNAYPGDPYTTVFTFNTALALGARGGDFANSFLGNIDELSFYNRALTGAEVYAIYFAGNAGKCAGPTTPSISVQPQDRIASVGTNVSFSVLAAGSVPLFYHWTFGGTNLPGATTTSLTLTNIQLTNAGAYQVVVSNSIGSVTSAVANLVIGGPPVIRTQPKDIAVSPGSTATFIVGVFGSPPLTFQWLLEGTNAGVQGDYALSVTNVQLINAGHYSVIITNIFGSVTSAPALLILNLPPTVTNQPAGSVLPSGANVTFNPGVLGSNPLAYQWLFNGFPLTGATNLSLSLFGLVSSNAGQYSLYVTNAFGFTWSSNANLSLTNPVCLPAPTGLVGWWQSEGSTSDSYSGAPGSLVGNATYAPGKIGQAFSFDGLGDGILLSNSPALQVQNWTIEAWVKRANPSRTSASSGGGLIFGYGTGGYAFGLGNDGRPFLSQIGLNQANASFLVLDTNWHHLALSKDTTNLMFYLDGVGYPGPSYPAVFSFGTPPGIGGRGDNFGNSFLGYVDELAIYNRAFSSNEVASIYFATTQGKCFLPLFWFSQPEDQAVYNGSNAVFTGSAAGSAPSYQWKFNGVPLAGATSSSLSLSPVTFFNAGSYSLVASNSTGPITSTNATLTVRPTSLLLNGSFESGNLTGWVVSDLSSPLIPVGIHSAGYVSPFGFFTTAPTEGSYCLTHGFDGNGPGRIRVAVDVYLPKAPVTLTFDYRVAWDMQNYTGSTLPRTFGVTIEPYGGGLGLLTNIVLSAGPGTASYDTGNLRATMDLSAYSGLGIRISFDAWIPEYFTGPGFFQLDNVVLTYPPVPPLLIARSGTNVVLTWPSYFSNFVVFATTNAASPGTWTALNTNLIIRAATNTSFLDPINRARRFYRLRSL